MQTIERRDALMRAANAIRHRGPDGEGEWWSPDGRIGLAHRRLAIVDLSTGAAQPMTTGDGQIALSFNGEVYNHKFLRTELETLGHKFKTSSDTEVVLTAYLQWGQAFLGRLTGMFALAIADCRANLLLLARDRVGEKPLFVASSRGGLCFASEIKAIAPMMRETRIDPHGLNDYLEVGYCPAPLTMVLGIRKLAPGSVLTFDLQTGRTMETKYWSPPEYRPTINAEELESQLESLLRQAVESQLQADVPVGILLSGGLDSSLVVAMAAETRSHLRTFTVTFPGQATYDESRHARLIAEHFGTQHTELVASEVSANIMTTLAVQFDDPIADSSMIPTSMVSQLVRQHCTVALGGDGADELFGGYGHYIKLQTLYDNAGMVPRAVRRTLARLAGTFMPPGFSGRNVRSWILAGDTDLARNLPEHTVFHDERWRRLLLPAGAAREHIVCDDLYSGTADGASVVSRATRKDFGRYLVDDILVKTDRSSMLHSLEMRAPFLDVSLVDFAFREVPPELKVHNGRTKVLLKRIAERRLPRAFAAERKQGFSIPLATWLQRGPFRDLFWDTLTSHDCLFNKSAALSLLKGQDKGRKNEERLFALVIFELWRRAYGASL